MSGPRIGIRLSAIALALAGALLIYGQPGPPARKGGSNPAPHVLGQLLVRFENHQTPDAMVAAHARVRAVAVARFKILNNLHLVQLPPDLSIEEAASLYLEDPRVLYAEPNYVVTTTGTPSDPLFTSLWGLHNIGQSGGSPDADIDAPEAWDITRGDKGVVVAVVDTGIDYNHPDLVSNVWTNTADCNTNQIDDDGNGYIDDCYGIDTANNDSDPMDDHSHGTHVAGTIGAAANNGIGVVGVSWDVSLMACKFISAAGSGTIAGAIGCLQYVQTMKDRGLNIIATSNSWGGGGFSQALLDAIEAHRQRGILFIAAAGNNTTDNDTTSFYPASYYLPNVLAVAATTQSDGLASFSNFGRRTVHVGAPGQEIVSTTPSNSYTTFSGTSMATPHVTGLAALLKAQDPSRDWKAIKNLLLSGGDAIASLGSTVTQKRLNAYGALTCSGSTVLSRLRPTANAITGTVGTPIDLSALHINCANAGGPVAVVVNPGGQTLTLLDDGLGFDRGADDGIYSSRWTPTAAGTFSLTFPGGDVVNVQVDTPPVDLIISSLSAPAITGAGASLSIVDSTRNQSSGSAQPSTTRFYLSSNTTFEASDTALGSRPVPSLSAGVSSSGTTPVTVPASTAAGPYYLIARADADGSVAESSESNNTLYRFIQVGPDLVVSALSVPPTAGAGSTIVVTDTASNQGGGSAAASTTRLYFSADTVLESSDAVLSSRAVPALSASATNSGSTSVTIPASAAAGSYYILAKADVDNAVAETSEGNNTLYRFIQIGPDLKVSSITAPASAGAGSPIVINDTTANQGAGSAGASTTRLYLSTNTTLDAADALLGSRAIPSLAPGTASSGATSAAVPAATTAGNYYILASADADNAVAETSENNNTLYRFIQVGPDLTVSSLSTPATAGAGTTILISDSTTNSGAGSADASSTSFYLSTNTTLDAADAALGGRSVAPLMSGATSSGTTSATVPAGTTTGTYYILAKADASGVVAETSEGNNTQYRLITVGPDLSVSSMMAPATAGAGSTIQVQDTTVNQGAGDAGPSTTRFYFSTNTTLDAADAVVGGRAVALLPGGAASSGATSVTIPAGVTPGNYFLLAKADSDNVVAEGSENNNTQYRFITIGPDLTISAISAPTTAGAGSAVAITDTTANQGAGLAGSSTTKIYFSTNTTFDTGDSLLGSRAVASLDSGATSSATTSVTIPAGTSAGTYYIIARADAEGLVTETSEGNNTLYRFIQIGPDLIVTAVSGPSPAAPGTTIVVGDTIVNQGGGLAAASTARIYLSANTTVDAADILLGERVVEALAAGATSSASLSVTIPTSTAPGNYFIIVKADAGSAVPETVETNNAQYRFIQISP